MSYELLPIHGGVYKDILYETFDEDLKVNK